MYQLNQVDYRGFVSGTTRLKLPQAPMRSIPLAIAPYPEQLRVVAEIDKQFTRLDAAVAALKRVQANLKRYRASVLKAACEGRLVPTEAELARAEGRDYEPADKLLARILDGRRARWEAEQLAKMQPAGKPAKDHVRKAEYKEPAPPDTANVPKPPEGWVWVSLEQISWDAGYGTSEKCDYGWSGPPVLRIPNIVSGKVDISDLKFAADSTELDESDELARGDFLVIRTNGSKKLIGRGALVSRSFEKPHFYASYLIRFRLLNLGSTPRWVSTLWDVPDNRVRIERLAATSAGQYNINIAKLNSIPLVVPPVAEQDRIVAEVERRLSVIEELETLVEASLKRAGRLRQAVLKRAFEGKLVPQDPNDEPASNLLERVRTERAQAATPETGETTSKRGRPKAMAQSKSAARRPILEVLNQAKAPLSPEKLFSATGHQPETIDEFYGELKAGVDGGQIEELRTGDEGILLRAKRA
jgi:type I restriction enzyme S subunit